METDFKVAALLQRQLDHENSKFHETDLHLALMLQNDFNTELSIEKPAGLVYENKKTSQNDTRSLIDPSWEVIDPTPDIHNLFMAFNQQFFWNKLLVVCVSWSKRMTSCAGICSYQGRGGLCSITLSEPLLKLRPRKDLVETLLHEMIHAYLFVTHNNRDRDGHGPEFHKHMYRINKEAGTNITVYHSFHDEVRLYQQHWWRCNGSCQHRKPYFGMVRRATNRAPGPNDRWWGEHSRSCGGTFIKVREPEKKTKNKKEGEVLPKSKPFLGDIRKFIPVTNNLVGSESNKSQANIRGINNLHTSTENTARISNVVSDNVHGFTNLSSPQRPIINRAIPKTKINNNIVKVAGNTKLKSNSNSTIVINKNTNNVSKVETSDETAKVTTPFNGIGNRLISLKQPNDNHNYSAVRNHWLNKFDSSTNKRDNLDTTSENSKKQKTTHNKVIQAEVVNISDSADTVHCPVCQKSVKESYLNEHLDNCLKEQDKINNKNELCFICNKEVPQSNYKNHVDNCFDNNIDNNSDEDWIECEICSVHFSKKKIDDHRKLCIEKIFAASTQMSIDSRETSKPSYGGNDTFTQCSVCDIFVESKELNNHKEKCILNVFENIEKKHNINTSDDDEILCLVCGTKILKSKLNIHLEDCMVSVFDESNDFIEETGKTEEIQNSKEHNCDKIANKTDKYNCPFCMELYTEFDMSGHLDQCLVSDLDKSHNKTIMIDSFSSDEI